MSRRVVTMEDMRAVQEKHYYNKHCGVCNRDYYESVVGTCPVSGRATCMYCCRMCEEHVHGFIGQECRKRKKR